MPGFRRSKVSPTDVARSAPPGTVNVHLSTFVSNTQERLDSLEKKLGTQSVDFNRQGPIAPVPPLAKFEVVATNGNFTVQITNPQNITSTATRSKKQNPIGTPILHRLAFSLTPEFDANGDVRTYPISTQTHWPIVDIGSSSRYVRLQSSVDGVNWNSAQVLGPFQS